MRPKKLIQNKGHSLVLWVTVFSVILAVLSFINTPLKRAIQGKVMALADFTFWTRWGDEVNQYKGDDTNFTKSKSSQNAVNNQLEVKKSGAKGYITNYLSSETTEDTVSSSVEDGSQAALKILDLNKVQP